MDNISIVVRRGKKELTVSSVPADFLEDVGKPGPRGEKALDAFLKIINDNREVLKKAFAVMVPKEDR